MALVSMRQLLDHAAENDYGVPAFNVNNLEQVQAIMQAGGFTNTAELGNVVLLRNQGKENPHFGDYQQHQQNYAQKEDIAIGVHGAATRDWLRSPRPLDGSERRLGAAVGHRVQ